MKPMRRTLPPCALAAGDSAAKARKERARRRSMSHVRIVGPAATFWGDPDDVLRRVLDVAGLAMHAILGGDLQPGSRFHVDEFIDAGRAVALLGTGVFFQVDLHRDRRVLEGEMRRLVLA